MAYQYEQHLTFSFALSRAQQRFRELLIYVSNKSKDDPFFGATKLNKILYYSDFRAFSRFGVPITGAKYFRLKKGPAPRAMVPIRREMAEEGVIRIEDRPMGNFDQKRIIPLRDAYIDLFSQDELSLVDEVIEEFWSHNADSVSESSHDIVWKTRNDKDAIPYEAAYLVDGPYTAAEIERTRELAKQFGWI